MYSALASAVNHPDAARPLYGVFNHRSLRALAEQDCDLDVIVPRPFAPPVGPYSSFSKLPAVENYGSYTAHHPRFMYYLPKRLLYGLSGRSFAHRVPPYVDEMFKMPKVVHACHIYLDGYGMLPYCRSHDIPLVVVAHGTVLNTYDNLPPLVRSKVRKTLEQSARVLCVSNVLAKKAERFVDSEKITMIPLGADPEKFPTERREEIRREMAIPDDKILVLFVGAFTERKGIDEIVSVLKRLKIPKLEFVFVGHGGDRRWDLQHALTRSPYSNEFVYWKLSPVALRRWFVAADLLWLPSHTEGRPTVVYEAMASETAVLATNVGGIPEQVVDGETGRLVSPRDAEALQTALVSITKNRVQLREMGGRGLMRLVENRWTWADHAERIRTQHQSVIERLPTDCDC